MEGYIEFFDPRHGIGFVSIASRDLFFHGSALPDQWQHMRLEHVPCEVGIRKRNGKEIAIAVRQKKASHE